MSFEPSRVVLEEHRAVVGALAHYRNGGSRFAIDRSPVVDLAMRVLTHAMLTAEAECHRIIDAAEARAAEIVQDARNDVARLASLVDRPRDVVALRIDSPPAVEAPPPSRAPAPQRGDPDAETDAETDAEIGADPGDAFFDSFSDPVEDPWSFMQDDGLVGVGPALRRLLRRPSPPQ